MKIIISSLILGSLVFIAGCSWVKTTTEGEKVRVLAAEEVVTCRDIGATTVSVVNQVGGIDRDSQKVAGELRILARNSAARIGGDTVVPISEVSDGEQRFAVYRCIGVAR